MDYSDYLYSSQVQILFKAAEFFPNILRQELTPLDFVSYCGGALGLFLGFSALSAVELMYYFSVRIAFDRRRKNKVSDCNDKTEKIKLSKKVMNNCSVHGFNQIVFQNRHFVER